MSVFADDWRECLREQYKHVIHQQDSKTRVSLTVVMNQVGFREEELRELEVEATMHVDDAPEDFVPDLAILQQAQALVDQANTFQPHPSECQCPQCVTVNLVPHDKDGQPIPLDVEELIDRAKEQLKDDDSDASQLSMF